MTAILSLRIETGSGPRRWPLYLAGAVIGIGVAILGSAPNFMRERAAAIADARAWTIEGPPCLQLPIAETVRQPAAAKAFGYADAGFAYAYGHVACAEIHENGGKSLFRGYPVCQFTSPGVVIVDAAGRTTLFAPGLGERATVSVRNGEARCVMAGRFYGQLSF